MPKTPSNQKVVCQNCDTSFKGNYCPECGQQLREFQKPFRFLIVDLAGNIFSFDTRLWRSIKSLILKPGLYTLEYINGHRMRFVPPLRLYVFISFMFFLLLSTYVNREIDISDETKISITADLDKKMEENEDTNNRNAITLGGDTPDLSQKDLSEIAKSVTADPSRYMNSFLTFVSWSLFLLMPVYAFLLWLFFMKSQPYCFSHLVFAVNQHAIVFLLSGLIISVKLLFPERENQPENLALWLIPIYMYIGEKQLYQKGWVSTFFRWLSISFLYLIVLLIVISLLFALWFKLNFL